MILGSLTRRAASTSALNHEYYDPQQQQQQHLQQQPQRIPQLHQQQLQQQQYQQQYYDGKVFSALARKRCPKILHFFKENFEKLMKIFPNHVLVLEKI